MLHHGRDTYSYVWPRDGAIVAHALDVAGYSDAARRFFTFMSERLERDGYLMHKYRSDGTLGSSWHPWMLDGEPILPIQEDETALVLYMLYKHYEIEKDIEYIESLYNPFIEPAADFMVSYLESRLGLPDHSFDLWEEKYGISTYTASAVFGALRAAAHFAQLLGKDEAVRTYEAVAQRMQSAILEHLWDDELGMFIKHIRAHDDRDDEFDRTVDSSSFFGPIYFGVLDPADERMSRAMAVVEERLRVRANSDGYIRYERDNYYTLHDAGSPNPWVVTTMWIAQFHIMRATSLGDLERPYELLEWTASHATQSGVLAEQMHPHTREHLSTAPLVWSHAEYVLTVQAYLAAHERLSDPSTAEADD
jgi:GH15 family glucan-1,4-alpha-glucosidase